MLGDALVIISDAHLGYAFPGRDAPRRVEAVLLDFLDLVPRLGDSLLVNGDLFEFWFAYERVIPRGGFRAAAALAQLARRMPVLMVGGNHDRWGRAFWQRDVGLHFAPDRLEFSVGDRRGLALHGDGIGYGRLRSGLLHRLVSSRLASAAYRALHPELGIPLVDALSARLGDHGTEGPTVDRAVAQQQAWAERTLAERPELGLIVLGHTHRPVLCEPAPGRQYLNPGAWFDGFRYAIATARGAELRQFNPAEPPSPAIPPGDRR
ncbi:MAG TPA: metallophosphoesterase [Gemmatimonadales bacterium]|nr:metallophosphoesterase [Gemmatimonadales bacterium]